MEGASSSGIPLHGANCSKPIEGNEEMNNGTHWIRGWVGLRAGLDTEARGKRLFAPAEVQTPIVRSSSL
jgi:hypothetical protein